MTLTIKSLRFKDFRNYPEFHLDGVGGATVFVGRNAIGKTNIIEGIQLLTATQSFRHQPLEYMIREGCRASRLECLLGDDVRRLEISLDIEKGKKSYKQNGKAKAATEMQGLAPSVTFTPDDLDLVKGPNTKRRNALDLLGCQVSKNYFAIKKDYEQILKQKNALLKEDAPRDLLESLNEVMITCGAQFTCYRHALLKRLAPYLKESYARFSEKEGERLSLRYLPSWSEDAGNGHILPDEDIEHSQVERDEVRGLLRSALDLRMAEEYVRHHAVVGPHADRVDFFLEGRNAAQFGSQGQQRSIVLAWKMAEVFLIEEMLGQRPILLLDDVMSELDEDRRMALTCQVRNSTQVFITTTNLMYFEDDFLNSASIISLTP